MMFQGQTKTGCTHAQHDTHHRMYTSFNISSHFKFSISHHILCLVQTQPQPERFFPNHVNGTERETSYLEGCLQDLERITVAHKNEAFARVLLFQCANQCSCP